jgi:hypothetical protein
MALFRPCFRNYSQEAIMTPEFERYDCRRLVNSRASESDKEFDAARFDELLTDSDRQLLQSDLQISWWAYSELNMRPLPQA